MVDYLRLVFVSNVSSSRYDVYVVRLLLPTYALLPAVGDKPDKYVTCR